MTNPTPPESIHLDPYEKRREAFRPVLGVATLLFTVGLLTGCLFPGLASRRAAAVPPPPPPPAQEAAPLPPPEPGPSAPVGGVSAPPPKEDPPKSQVKPLPQLPADQPSQLVVHGDRSCKMLTLTYDAGSGADGAGAILDVLKKHQVRTTFFLTGKWVEKYPDLAKRIAAEGHEIGNHSYSHPDLTKLTDTEVLQQLKDGEEAIRQVTGQDPRPLFREPYGAFSDHERTLVRQAGYSYSIYWDLDTLDWQFPGVEVLTNRILKAQSGSVVLMHLNVPDTAVASDRAIPELIAKGYTLVPISELLQCKAE